MPRSSWAAAGAAAGLVGAAAAPTGPRRPAAARSRLRLLVRLMAAAVLSRQLVPVAVSRVASSSISTTVSGLTMPRIHRDLATVAASGPPRGRRSAVHELSAGPHSRQRDVAATAGPAADTARLRRLVAEGSAGKGTAAAAAEEEADEAPPTASTMAEGTTTGALSPMYSSSVPTMRSSCSASVHGGATAKLRVSPGRRGDPR